MDTTRGRLAAYARPADGDGPTAVPVRLCLFGAAPDSGNLGVSALMIATVLGIAARRPRADLTVFDNGVGRRTGTLRSADTVVRYQRLGARIGRRYHRPENLVTMQVLARVGGRGSPGVTAVRQADAVLDVSGGDSFTDLYGPARLDLVSRPKELALRLGTPLVLLPQTYGPFRSRAARDRAARIVRGAATAVARGADSYALLHELLGPAFDPQRHRQGVDLAFGMPATAPGEDVQEWVERLRADGMPVVGLNLSGLLYGVGDASATYGLTVDYRAAVRALATALLAEGVTVVLVPHVLGAGESDRQACVDLVASLGNPAGLVMAPEGLDAQQTKWLIARTDWFCGTRMHATIAALSSGVPAAAIAYSAKTREVFASCGLADEVADGRTLSTADLVAAAMASWRSRGITTSVLRANLPAVAAVSDDQMEGIIDTIGRSTARTSPAADVLT